MEANNKQIIAQLTEIAREYFATLDLDPGTYTAAELAANMRTGDKTKRPIYQFPDAKRTDADDIDGLYNWERMTVADGAFICEFPRALVFNYLWKFEQLEKTGQKDKARFTREKEGGATFFVTIPKESSQLAKFVGTDTYRPNMEYIYLDPERGALVATDTHILAEFPAMVEGCECLPKDTPAIYISPKHIKNLFGRTRVQIVEEEGKKFAIYTNEAGEVYKNELNRGKYPDYRRAYPKVSPAGYLQIAPAGVKAVNNFIKTLKKDIITKFEFSVAEGANEARLTYNAYEYGCNREIAVTLAYPAPVSFVVGLGVNECAAALGTWNGGMWLTDPSRPVIFDSNSARAILVMPVHTENANGAVNGDFCATLERANNLPAGVAAPKVKVTKTRAKATPANAEEVKLIENPKETEAAVTDAEIISFADWLVTVTAMLLKLAYRFELSQAMERVKELAQLAEVDIIDVLADAVPMDVETLVNVPENASELVKIGTTAERMIQNPYNIGNFHFIQTDCNLSPLVKHLKYASKSTRNTKMVKCITRTRGMRETARKQQNSVVKYCLTTEKRPEVIWDFQTARNVIFPPPGNWSAANSPPTGRPPRTLPTGSTKRIYY